MLLVVLRLSAEIIRTYIMTSKEPHHVSHVGFG